MNKNAKLQAWVDEVAKMCQPDSIHWCDGSAEENEKLLKMMVDSGAATPLNPEKRPGCYLFRSDRFGRRPRRKPYLYRLCRSGRCRTDQQLGRSGRTEKHDDGTVQRLHERPHHVRHSVLDGPDRLADLQDRR